MSLLWKVPLIVVLVVLTLVILQALLMNPGALVLVLISAAVLAVPVAIGYLTSNKESI